MFGPSLLVAPVLEENARRREVYLPAGEWIDMNQPNRRILSRGEFHQVEASLEIVPCFVQAGAIIPRGDVHRGNNTWDADWQPRLDLNLFVPSATRMTSHFDYYDGKATHRISFKKTPDRLSARFDGLGIAGTVQVHLDPATDRQLRERAAQLFLNDRALTTDQYKHENGKLSIEHEGAIDLVIRPAEASAR